MNKVELQNLVGGQLQEKFEHAFERVIEPAGPEYFI